MDTEEKSITEVTPADGPAAPEAPESTAEAGVAADVSDLDPQALEALKAEAGKAKEHWERLVRATADFDNYKKRVTRERQEASKYAFVPLLERLLPVLDHFDIALTTAQNSSSESIRAFHEGMMMIYQQLRSTLLESGLEEIDASGKPFDHNLHEAVSQLPSADVPEGQVIQQLRKGYKFRDRLLRPASVVVAKAPETEPAPGMDASSAARVETES